jgi:protein-S-isoprenylcysteine O-methyltransferase Ste14
MAENKPDSSRLPPLSRFLVRRRTFFSWALPLLLVLSADPWGPLLVTGAALVAVGVGIRLWASGHLFKSERLATSGPFSHLRNPLYLGSLVMLLGYCAMSARWWAYPVFLALFALFYYPTIRWEEAFLRGKFGKQYEDYVRQVPRLVPRLTAAYPEGERFSWLQARRNGELTSAALAAAMIALFILRLAV